MTDTSNVIALDARHPADQPKLTDEEIKARVDKANKAWHEQNGEKKETPPSVRAIAREQGIDLKSLIEILEIQRPAGSKTEESFVEDWIGSLTGALKDDYGNHYVQIGEAPNIMWSCHTDTVAKQGGKQNVKWDGDILRLNEPKQGQCLGADDGAGLWLLLEMIKAEVPGLYIFHREEEVGRRGSEFIAEHHADLLKGIQMSIAFDRRDVDSVITFQSGQRTCSKEFAEAMAARLNQIPGFKYELDPTGSYTDTYSYAELIPECTNISVGYYNEHSAKESLDVAHLLRLRTALISFDFSDLPVKRDPTEVEYDYYGGYGSYSSKPKGPPKTDLERMVELIGERKHTVAQIFFNMGLNADDLEDMMYRVWQRTKFASTSSSTSSSSTKSYDKDHEESVADYLRRTDPDSVDGEDIIEEYALWCNDCQDFTDQTFNYSDPAPGDACPHCYQTDTELIEVEVDAVTGEIVA